MKINKTINKKPILIEFIGLPGAGKSTVVRRLSTNIKNCITGNINIEEGIDGYLEERINKLGSRIKNLLADPIYVTKLYTLAILSASFNSIKRVETVCGYKNLLINVHKHCKDLVLIKDEGVLHSLYSMFISNNNIRGEYFIKNILRYTYEDYSPVFIYLDVDVENGIERFKNRKTKSRFSKGAADHMVRRYMNSKVVYEQLINIVDLLYPSKINIINANESYDQSYENVVKIIKNNITEDSIIYTFYK